MNVNVAWPSAGQWKAIGRHAVTYSAGAATGIAGILTFAVTFHFISTDQSTQITSALTDVGKGVKAVVDGLTTIVGACASLLAVGSGIWSAYSASKRAQSASLAAQGSVVITDSATAAAVPSPNVVSAHQAAEVNMTGAVVQVAPR